MNCSVAKKSVKRVCYSLKSRGKTFLEVSGGGENEEEKETFVRKVEKGVRKKRVGIPGRSWRGKGLMFFGERSSGKISLWGSVRWRTPIIPCVCYWDGRGFLAGFMRASSSVRKVERGVRREECENSREFHGEEERGWCFLGRSSGKISLKVERGVRREERENFMVKRKGVDVFCGDLVERSA